MAAGARGLSPWLQEMLEESLRRSDPGTVRGLYIQVKENVASGKNEIRVPEGAAAPLKEIIAHCKATYKPEEGAGLVPALAARLDSLIGAVATRLGPNGLDRVHDMTLADFAAQLRGQALRELTLIPGGYSLAGRHYRLTGKAVAMLKALLEEKQHRCLASALAKELEVDPDAVTYPEQVLRDTAKKLRASLRRAANEVGLTTDNPLPSTGRGADLAYSLAI
jgi:hypothetical protein